MIKLTRTHELKGEKNMPLNIDNLKLIVASSGISKNRTGITSRKYNSFIFRTSGSATYNFENKKLIINKGNALFIPKGIPYSFEINHPDTKYVSISFEADIENPEPKVYSFENFSESDFICNNFPELIKLGNRFEKYQCYAVFYNFLSFINLAETTDSKDKQKFEVILPAINHLKKHIFDTRLKTGRLHALCGISDAYFRRIFLKEFGISPSQYITEKRLSQAKSLIDNGDFDSISEIALSVGYSDPLYFSRQFKKRYGISPLNMSKRN